MKNSKNDFCDDPTHLFSLEAACTLKFAKCDFVEDGTFILDFQEFLLCKLIYDHSEEYVYVCKDRWLGNVCGGVGIAGSEVDFKRQFLTYSGSSWNKV